MQWPAQNLELIAIEHLGKSVRTHSMLKKLSDEWRKTKPEIFRDLVD